jgi:hypothetical protein
MTARIEHRDRQRIEAERGGMLQRGIDDLRCFGEGDVGHQLLQENRLEGKFDRERVLVEMLSELPFAGRVALKQAPDAPDPHLEIAFRHGWLKRVIGKDSGHDRHVVVAFDLCSVGPDMRRLAPWIGHSLTIERQYVDRPDGSTRIALKYGVGRETSRRCLWTPTVDGIAKPIQKLQRARLR